MKNQAGKIGLGGLILLIFVFIVVFSLVGNKTQNPKPPSTFTSGGYFKSGVNDRVFSVFIKPGVTIRAARSYANSKPNTPGQMTAVYFYDEGSKMPIDGVTQAPNLFQLNETIRLPGLSKWRFAYMKYRNGTVDMVDCGQAPDHDLCW